MITSIRGSVMHLGDNFFEVICGDIGYKIYCTAKTLSVHSVGQDAEIFTHLHIREDAHTLYGFQTRKERDFFEQLIAISGIGPKSALGVLSAAPLGMLKKAIVLGDTSVLTRVSGIGQKIAQRVIMELKGKLEEEGIGGVESLREGGDVIDALMGLGYSRYQAQQALRQIPENIEGVENKVKQALKILAK